MIDIWHGAANKATRIRTAILESPNRGKSMFKFYKRICKIRNYSLHRISRHEYRCQLFNKFMKGQL